MDKKVVITKTPFRLSFAGGGTDIPDYYRNYGTGAVVSAAMNRYMYITVNENFFENSYRAHYRTVENDVTNIKEIQHPVIREALELVGINKGVEISSVADMPSKGTGVGSSSSFAVGLLNALHTWKGDSALPEQLAREAVKIEREILKEAGGKQDQYIAAFGGIALMEFGKDESVNIKQVEMEGKQMREMEKYMMLMYTGKERKSADIHVKQGNEVRDHVDAYRKMVDLAHRQFDAMVNGNWRDTGKLLHENWMLKKSLAAGISDPYIDRLYDTAMKNGAEGGKIMGAGGGGFFLFFAEPEKHEQIMESLPELKQEHIGFEIHGSRVIYSQGLEGPQPQ